jgi:hypothetical protein
MGGAQPHAPRKLPPSLLNVPNNPPPFQFAGRSLAQQQLVVALGQAYNYDQRFYTILSGGGPEIVHKFIPSGITVNNPPFNMRASPNLTSVLTLWSYQGPPWFDYSKRSATISIVPPVGHGFSKGYIIY